MTEWLAPPHAALALLVFAALWLTAQPLVRALHLGLRQRLLALAPASRQRVLLGLALGPVLVAGLVLFVMFSGLGEGHVLIAHCHAGDVCGAHLPVVGLNLLMFLVTLGLSALLGWRLQAALKRFRLSGEALARAAEPVASGYWRLPCEQALALCVGLIHPRAYLSSGLIAALSDQERDIVLAHELQHVRARDNLRLLLVDLVMGPRWGRALRADLYLAAELRADQAAVDRGHRPADVAATLVHVCRLTRKAATPNLAFARHGVEARVAALLQPPPAPPAAWPWGLGLTGAVIGLSLALISPVHLLLEWLFGLL